MGFGKDIPEQVQGTSHASVFLTGKGKRPASQLYIWVPLGKHPWGHRGLRTHRYTLMISKTEAKPVEYLLHDNVNDPYQLKNIAAEKPDVLRKLTKELNEIVQRNNDPWLTVRPRV